MKSADRHRLTRHLTFANVVACLALFVALGGASYAAFKLPKESVGTEALRKAAVTPAKLSDKARQGMTGARGPQGATGPAGPAGPQGGQGPQGAPGPSAVYAYSHAEDVPIYPFYLNQVAALAVPAGSYAIQARIVPMSTPSQLYVVACELRAGADRDELDAFLDNNGRFSPSNTSFDEEPLPFQLVHTFTEPGQITIGCYFEGPSSGLYVENLRITAVEVGEIAADAAS